MQPASTSVSSSSGKLRMKSVAACDKVFGSAHIEQHPSRAVIKSNLLYMPIGDSSSGGIFDIHGKAIQEAVNFRGESRLPISQSMQISVPSNVSRYHGAPLLYIGMMYPHFGHFITTTLSRFWFLRQAKRGAFRLLCHNAGTLRSLFARQYVAEIFEALNIHQDDFVSFQQPTLIESDITLPAPCFEENYGGNHSFIECSRFIGEKILGGNILRSNCPVYLSKAMLPAGLRGFVNELDVEQELRQRGVHIINPELNSFSIQLQILASHDQVIGSVGSAMHSSIFLPEGKRIIGLNQTAQLNSNFLILDRLCGNFAKYVYPRNIEEVEDTRFRRSYRIADPKEVAKELFDLL